METPIFHSSPASAGACWRDLRIPALWVSPARCARQRPGDNATSAAASHPGCHSTWWRSLKKKKRHHRSYQIIKWLVNVDENNMIFICAFLNDQIVSNHIKSCSSRRLDASNIAAYNRNCGTPASYNRLRRILRFSALLHFPENFQHFHFNSSYPSPTFGPSAEALR